MVPPRLYFLCGKMAAGKSTLARELARKHDAVLLVQDDFLATLWPDEITSVADFVDRSARLRRVLEEPICSFLSRGVAVVLDFPGNTKKQRAWFRSLFEQSGVDHELHYVVASDELCKKQLSARCEGLPESTAWTTAAEFDAITKYFQEPLDEEGFHIVRHERS